MITLVKAAFVIGFERGDHVIIPNGEVAYQDQDIIFVGRGFGGAADTVIDAGNALLSPGFIDLDALADIDHAILDTWHGSETAGGLEWSEDYFRHRRHDLFPPDDRNFRHEFAFCQLIRNGITTAMPIGGEMHNEWCETYEEWAAAADIAARLGLRAYMGPSYRAGVNVTRTDGKRDVLWDEPRGAAGLADAIGFFEDFDGAHGGLIRAALLPARIETLTPQLMRDTAAARDRLGALVRLHCLQGETELALLRRWHDRSPLELLAETGLLGPSLLLPHAIYLGGTRNNRDGDSGDLGKLAASGASVIHCPMTSIRYGTMLDSFPRLREAGINVALGTDSYPPDMIRNMDIGVHLAKFREKRLDAASASEMFRSATLGGARALRRDDLGRLAIGAKADMVIVDLDDPRIGAIDDPIRTLLLHCTGANVATVIINGRVVMANRAIAAVDAGAMHTRVQSYFATMKAGYTERDYLGRPTDKLFPSSFEVH